MPADASIYQQFLQQPKSVLDYQNQYNEADTKKNALQQSVLALQKGQMDMANAADVSRQRNALRDAITSGQIDLSNPDHVPKALALAPDVAPAMLKTVQEGATSRAVAAKDTADAGKTTQETQIAGHAQHLQALSMVNSPQDAVQWMVDGVRGGALPSANLQANVDRLQQASATPEGFAQWKQQMQAAGLTVQQQMEQTTAKPTEVRLGNVVKTIDMNPRSQTFGKEVVSQQAIGVSPDTAATQTGSNARAGLNPDGTPRQMPVAADGSLDLSKVLPEDLAAAHRYRADGTLPPNMGRGAQGAVESQRIRAIASALDSQAGESPEDARIRQLALKGDVGAVAAMRKREVAIGANVKNFDFNADQVLQLSGKLDRTGVPIVNAWLNAGRRAVTGNPDLAAFDTALKTTVNEFAQIVGGTTSGASTEGEKKKAEALLNAQQTPEQILAVINQMRVESKNRMDSFARQRLESMPTNGAKPTAQAGSAAQATGAAPSRVSNAADYAKLPKGAQYIAPDGSTRTKQ